MGALRFLSDEWFAAVAQLAADGGDGLAPDGRERKLWNIIVEMADGSEKNLRLEDMLFKPGHSSGATTTMFMEESLLKKLFLDGDTMAGMFAFMSGDMRIEGDVTVIASLQADQPSDGLKRLRAQIKEVTRSSSTAERG